jgi:transcriptional regulator with PAS, ATPase and Fis domain
VTDATKTLFVTSSQLVLRLVQLTVLDGPDKGHSAVVGQPGFTVGSGPQADLRLTDPSVSREHLRLFAGPLGVRCVDGGSKNGTFFHGARVREITLSQDGTLSLGNTVLGIKLQGDKRELPVSDKTNFGEAIGVSPTMRAVFAALERAADSDLSILLEGESGVGKDVLARAVHQASSRRDGPFTIIDCGAIQPALIESELFGHVRGAFTGAESDRSGALVEANGGTLFLDEVGELPLDLQPKLLRVLEAREVLPVGGRTRIPINVRVVAATNRHLAEASRLGEFRSDLFYRLAVIRLQVPPLRERKEDILPIAEAMLRKITGNPEARVPQDLAVLLRNHEFPGNVRELRNALERFAVFGLDQGVLFDKDGAKTLHSDDALLRLDYHEAKKLVSERFEEFYIPAMLAQHDGVITRAAEAAGISRQTFYRLLERLRLSEAPDDATEPSPR